MTAKELTEWAEAEMRRAPADAAGFRLGKLYLAGYVAALLAVAKRLEGDAGVFAGKPSSSDPMCAVAALAKTLPPPVASLIAGVLSAEAGSWLAATEMMAQRQDEEEDRRKEGLGLH